MAILLIPGSGAYTDAEAIAAVEAEDPLDLAGDVLIAAAKKLGIGTTTPDALLEVALDANTPPTISADTAAIFTQASATGDDVNISLIAGATGSGRIHFGDTADENIGMIVYDHNSNSVAFITNASEAMRIDSSGRLGIGSTAPVKELHIVGTVPTIRLSDSDAGTDQAVATLIEFFRGETTNRVGFLGMGSSSNDVLVIGTDYGAGEIRFATGSNVLAVTISSGQLVTFAGDVEIDGAKSLKVDVIDEKDAAAGVTVENVTVKDGAVEFHHGTDTISTDEITSPTGGYIIAAAQTGTTDDLDGIGGGANGRVIVVRADAGDVITVKHSDAGAGTGRKLLNNGNASITLTGNDEDSVTFMYDESLDSSNGAWFEIARGEAAAASGDVATDTIWDAKGDLAGGTGADTAAKLVVGADGTVLGALASETTGLVYLARSATAQLADIANSESAGTNTTIPFGDHVHAHPSGLTANLHHTKYADSDAIAAVEGEATLVLAGDVTIDGAKTLGVDVINEKDADAGVTIDSVLLKDGVVTVGDVAFDDATSDPLPADSTAAADGVENSVARKDHRHFATAATASVQGISELATITETNTGTDATRAVTPDGLDGWTGSAQIVTTGALDTGSITSGFGAIDIGSSALTTTGTITGPSGTWDVGGMDIAASDSYAVAGTDILSDSTGTMTLSNIDALDATTETTIEAAIDTLANLTSIQSLTVTLADAGADAIFGWDDTAAEYSNLTQAEVLAVIGDASATAKGVSELATAAETSTGTDTARTIPVVALPIQIQNSKYVFAVDAEASDAYVITLVPPITAYAAGQVFHFDANTANTGAATLAVDGLAATTIKKQHDLDLATNDIEVGQFVTVIYDGTNFQMQSQIGNNPSSTDTDAIHDNVASEITAITEKTAPVGNDEIIIEDSADTNAKKSLKLSNLEKAQTSRKFSYSITVEDPTSSEDISIAFTNRAITITEMRAVLIGSSTPSVTWTIKHNATDRNNAGAAVVTASTVTTSTTTGSDVTSFDDATIPLDSFIWLETSAQSGTVTEIHISILGTED